MLKPAGKTFTQKTILWYGIWIIPARRITKDRDKNLKVLKDGILDN